PLPAALQLRHARHRGAGAGGVDVSEGPVDGGEGLLHAAHRTLPGGGDHVVAVGGGAVADDLGVDVGAPGEGVFQLLHHHAAGAAGHHEAIAVGVVGAGGQFRRVVVLGGQGAHGVEHAGHGPVLLLGAAGEEDVLLAELDLLHRSADAVGAGGAGGGDGKIETLDLEGGGETGGDGARHDLGDPVGAGALDALLPYHVDGFDEFLPGYAAGAH